MVTKIQLQRTWQVHERIGEGGFGNVFRAIDDGSGEEAALKIVPLADGGTRELVINDALRVNGFSNVVPILDEGINNGSVVLVMPLADTSLAEYIQSRPTGLEEDEVVEILTDVATALAELNGTVVHRDLKPQNILRLEGRWQIADFGIARSAEATTAVSTKKDSFTTPYAAPEQWRYERASAATDVYALGIIAYQLVQGRLPFSGRNASEYREQHISVKAPTADGASFLLRTLIGRCLLKSPSQRPTAATLLELLGNIANSPKSTGESLLSRAYAKELQDRADADAEAERLRLDEIRTSELQNDGIQLFDLLPSTLFAAIEEQAPELRPVHDINLQRVSLLAGELIIGDPATTDVAVGPFRVIAVSEIRVTQRGASTSHGRAHALWFCDAFEPDHFAWYQMGFAPNVLMSRGLPEIMPFALTPDAAASVFDPYTAGEYQLNGPMVEINPGDPLAFAQPWIDRFASAAHGELLPASFMPEGRDDGRWRRNNRGLHIY